MFQHIVGSLCKMLSTRVFELQPHLQTELLSQCSGVVLVYGRWWRVRVGSQSEVTAAHRGHGSDRAGSSACASYNHLQKLQHKLHTGHFCCSLPGEHENTPKIKPLNPFFPPSPPACFLPFSCLLVQRCCSRHTHPHSAASLFDPEKFSSALLMVLQCPPKSHTPLTVKHYWQGEKEIKVTVFKMISAALFLKDN